MVGGLIIIYKVGAILVCVAEKLKKIVVLYTKIS